nr:helicase-related protein [Paenibacillus shirakamiensis]
MPLSLAVGLRDLWMLENRMDHWSAGEWQSGMKIVLSKIWGKASEQLWVGKSPVVIEEGGLIEEGAKRRANREYIPSDIPYLLWSQAQGYTNKGLIMMKKAQDIVRHAEEQLTWNGDEWGGRESESRSKGTKKYEDTMQQEIACRVASLLKGRSLLLSEWMVYMEHHGLEKESNWLAGIQLAYLNGRIDLTASIAPPSRGGLRRRTASSHCRRCGSVAMKATRCASCGSDACTYCEACLAMGRSRSCALLLRGAHRACPADGALAAPSSGGRQDLAPVDADPMGRWGLSPAQREAASAALRFLEEPPSVGGGSWWRRRKERVTPARFLLWAVTGAGKTEMIFPLLSAVLQRGGRALVATPRRDVVLELAPRIAAVFPDTPPVVLYGGSPERWTAGRLVLATTHQLLRFHQSFDLVIIDELDAFPYHNDPMLAFAAEQSCKPQGKFIYLSATPPVQMQLAVRRGALAHVKVPARYHGHPLPVPTRIEIPPLQQCLRHAKLPVVLRKIIEKSTERGAQLFIFVSRIHQIESLVNRLRQVIPPHIRIEGTSSKDERRAEKVLAFRAGEIQILITTTILERGVTVPRSDVIILDADGSLFDEASLVQMAGRAGRSASDPAGQVTFYSPEWTNAQRGAIRQIRRMNRIARRKGYLHELNTSRARL